MTTLKQRDLTV